MSRKVTYTEENKQLHHAQEPSDKTLYSKKRRRIAKLERAQVLPPLSSAYIGGEKEQFQR